MLSFAADFWPLFWTIIGAGALVRWCAGDRAAFTAGRHVLPPTWFRSHQRHQPTLTPAKPAEQQAGHHYQADQQAKAA